MDQPELWIVAGPNGSGKSTLVSRQDVRRLLGLGDELLVLNPDEVNRVTRERWQRRLWLLQLLPRIDDLTNLVAVRQVERDLAAALESGRNVLVETVLSTDKYLEHVQRARERGFLVAMIYVALPTPDDNVLRVSDRRARGGHDVPLSRSATAGSGRTSSSRASRARSIG